MRSLLVLLFAAAPVYAQTSDDNLFAQIVKIKADRDVMLKQMNAMAAEQAAQRAKIDNLDQRTTNIEAAVKALTDAAKAAGTVRQVNQWDGPTMIAVPPPQPVSSMMYSSSISMSYGRSRTPVRSFLRRLLTLGH